MGLERPPGGLGTGFGEPDPEIERLRAGEETLAAGDPQSGQNRAAAFEKKRRQSKSLKDIRGCKT